MRVHIRRQNLPAGDVFRIVEADGRPCSRWTPLEPLGGPLDKGGFDTVEDAQAFALGVDRYRAQHGLISGHSVGSIDQERYALDLDKRKLRHRPKPVIPEFEAA